MLFSSNIFLFVFLPIALLGYHLLGRAGRTATFAWLSAVSLFFYGYWNPKYLILLVASILLNFAASRWIATARSERTKSAALFAAIVANIGLLFWFKYLFPLLHFFTGEGWLARDFGTILLPLGISFFTFTQIAYLVDLRQGAAQSQGLLSYVLFVTFFPHLIAGPIIHHGQMMPQFNAARRHGLRADDMAVGSTWFLLGLAKKVLIADRFGPIADALYRQPSLYDAQASWAGILCYAVQLYFDFSGYSDMAMGLARMFSLTFPLNFNSPYKASSIIDYWQRWHITLTQYITAYVYSPLQFKISAWRQERGKKVSRKAQATLEGFCQMIAFPTIFTLAVAGIWHGAGLQYFLYGLMHGLYLTLNHAWRIFRRPPAGINAQRSPLAKLIGKVCAVGLTFLAVLISQVMFRAHGTANAFYVWGSLLGLHHGDDITAFSRLLPIRLPFASVAAQLWIELSLVFVIVWAVPNTQEVLNQVEEADRLPSLVLRNLRWQPNVAWAIGLIGATALIMVLLIDSTSFLYFQF